VQLTHAGYADTITGTVRLAHEVDDAEITELPVPRRTLPIALLDREVWRHRIDVVVHSAGFHLARTPRYAWRLGYLSALGAWTELRTACNYLLARDDFGQMIDETKRHNYGADHLAQLRADRRTERKARLRENTTVLGLTGFTTYTTALIALATVWGMGVTAPFFIPAVGFLAACGVRELGRRTEPFEVFEQAAVAEDAPLTDVTLNQALRKAKVLGEEQVAELVGPIRSVAINACEATLKLPSGVTAPRVIAAHEALAEALNVEPGWLDIRQAGHPNRISMWIATSEPFADARVSPLVENPERQDAYNKGVPIGFNRRGEVVYLKLRHVMALLGGMSRTGKGMLLRSLICGLGLDPRVNIRLAAGAKPGEHIGYAPVCATFFGRRPERLLALLKAFQREALRREAYLEDQGRSKMGEEDLDQFPWEILIIDELKQYTGKGKPLAEDISQVIEDLAAFVAALNMSVVLSTQDPDKDTVPRGYKSNSGARMATRTGSPTQTNAILKEGATGNGMRAHELPPDRKGLTILDIDGLVGVLIRSFIIEDEAYDGAAPIITAGRRLRETVNRAPGQFFDPIEAFLLEYTGLSSVGGGPGGRGKPERPTAAAATLHRSLLADLLNIFEARRNPDRLRTAEILAVLAEDDPETWSPKALGVSEDDEKGWASKGGTRLSEVIAQELDGTGRTLSSKEWTKGGRGRGYYLADVRAAAGIAPE
jgi:S-DNA-T family DNA segregation ATPase FtsK/SpoIIIE